MASIDRNLDRLGSGVTSQPHERNLGEWRSLVERRDLLGVKRVLTGLDRDSIEIREVSPMSGLLSNQERRHVRAEARRGTPVGARRLALTSGESSAVELLLQAGSAPVSLA